jgi:hypothetical protein
MRSFLESQGIGRAPSPQASSEFLTNQLYRKKGGRVQDYTDRSDDAVGTGRKRASGGKAMHDDEPEDRSLIKKMVKGEALTGRCEGGRMKRASGGKAGKSTVNVIIGGMPQGGQQQGGPGMDPMLMAALAGAAGGPPPGAPPAPPPGAPPAGAPPMAPPMAAPPMPMPPPGPGGPGPMPRADGGKVQVPYKKPGKKDGYPKMDFGAGGAFGRKQKIDSYGTKQK